MGIIFDMLQSLDQNQSIAMEADDITGDVKAEAANASGGSSDSGEISLNTDHIFGDDSNPPSASNADTKGSQSDTKENGEPEGDPDGENQEGDSTEDGGDAEDDGDPMDEMGEGEDSPNDVEGDSPDVLQKRKLKEQLQHLYDIAADDIQLLSEYIPNVTTTETSSALGNIKKNLSQLKDYIHDILKDEYGTLEYPILMKKFIALRQIYDLSTKAIETYFKDHQDKKTT